MQAKRLAALGVCLIAILFALALPSFAQQDVSVSEKPSREAVESRFYRDGSGNTEYICTALGTNVVSVWTRSATTSRQPRTPSSVGGNATLTSIVVASNVATATTSAAHGLSVGQWVKVEGATVDTDLNSTSTDGAYKVASVPTGTTFTFSTSSVADATYNESTLKLSTTAPRTNALVWAVRKLYYTGTNVDRDAPAVGSNAMDKSCDLRADYF